MNLYKSFDKIGIFVFAFLTVDSLVYLQSGETDWRVWLRLAIGISGLFVDGYLVFFYKK
ncbi:MAG: hypothetical protein HYS43_01035 [Candidatus Liptonbacteria bacterium]|nr:hypothetical protein [Candidatus Liptonbacteria bacterium]